MVSSTLSPTVEMSTCQPLTAQSLGVPFGAVEETPMTPLRAAGYMTGFPLSPSLPAEATTEMFLSSAYWMAAALTSEKPTPESDRLMTSAPWSAAQRTPRAMAADGHPVSLQTRTGMT